MGVGEAHLKLGSLNLHSVELNVGVGKLEKRDGRWINPRHESAPVTIRLDVKGGIGEIHLVAE